MVNESLKKFRSFTINLTLVALIGTGGSDLLGKAMKYLPNQETFFRGFYQGKELMAGRSSIDGKKYIWLQEINKSNNLTINAHDWHFEGDYGHLSADGDLNNFVGYILKKDNLNEWNKTLRDKLDLAYENIVVEPDPTIF
jgi:hypothetical protein